MNANNKGIIRLFSEPNRLPIIDRAIYITEKQQAIGKYFDKNDWYLFDKTEIDIRNCEQVTRLLLKRIKKRIEQSTTLKNISDDYIDRTATVDGYYATKKLDNDASFRYTVGLMDEYNTTSSLIINNFYSLKDLNDFSGLRKFILFLAEIFQPYSIQVSESFFYRDLMDLASEEYWFGWMTYFSKGIKIPEISSDIKVEQLPNGDKLLITTAETFTSENPEHLRKAKLLVELFRKNNVKMW
jgi:hypothetical protein